MIPHLERELSASGIRHFDPSGQSVRRTALHAFLESLLSVLQNPTFGNADAFLRLPDAWDWLAQQDDSIQPTDLLRGLDDLRLKHLPADLAAATQLNFEKRNEWEKIGCRITARSALRLLQSALGELENDPLSVGLAGFLKTTLTDRQFDSAKTEDEICIEVIGKLNARLVNIDAAVPPEAMRHMALD